MLIFLKYNLRAIDYNLDLLKTVPLGFKLPNNEEPVNADTSDPIVLTESEESDSESDDMDSLSLSSESDFEV